MPEEIKETQQTETLEETTAVETSTEETAVKEPPAEETKVEAEEPKEEKPRNDTVPLAKYLDTQRKLKEYERKMAADAEERERLRVREDLIKRGYPEAEAEIQAREKIEIKRELELARRERMEGQIERLARSEEFYADVNTFRDELLDVMREKSVDAKQAYLLLRGDIRLKELRTKDEQRSLMQRREAVAKKTATATATPVTSDYAGMDNDDKKALAMLQKVQPDAGWTPEKYKKMMKGS